MRTASLVAVLSVVLALETQSQSDAAAPYAVTSRSAHETVWQSAVLETNALGRVVERTNSYTELATGLNYFDETTQQWVPSREEWQVYPDGIVAQAGRHKVILATANLTLGGCVEVDVLTADGVRVVCTPISLGFYDPVDGKQVLVAEVKADCKPEWGAAPNEILFRDCYDRIRGSLRFVYNLAGVRQHIVLEQKLELPEGFSEKSRLECYTVFAPETPAPSLKTRVLRREPNAVLRAQMVEPDFTDSEISFGGEMTMRAGKAFSLGDETQERAIRVGKQWVEIESLPVLIEAVEFKQLEPLLAGLAAVERPKTDGLAVNTTRQLKLAQSGSETTSERASLNGSRPSELPRITWSERLSGLTSLSTLKHQPSTNRAELASRPLESPAVIVDWEYLSSQTNFVLRGDQTFFVTNAVYLDGVTIIEGSACVKFATNTTAQITIDGTVDCQTAPYRPAVFTVKDDNSVGQAISGSTGSPAGHYGAGVVVTASGNLLKHLRFSHAATAVTFWNEAAGELAMADCQWVKCATAIHVMDECTVYVRNGLFFKTGKLFSEGNSAILRAEHVTINECDYLNYAKDGLLYFTNSLLVAVTNWSGSSYTIIATNHTPLLSSGVGVFQTVGAGAHYLATNSPYRNAGTTNLNADLLAALRQKTTYPPVLLSNVTLTASTNLLPQVARDTDTPDLGYHYDPLDFIVAQCVVTNATLTLSNGVALGYYNRSAGIWLQDHSAINSVGSPLSPNWFAHYTLVQEQSVIIGDVPMTSALAVNSYHYGATGPEGHYRFTYFSCPGGAYSLYHAANWAYSDLMVRDCQFWNGGSELTGDEGSVAAFHNNLFVRAGLGAFADASSTLTLSNNLVRNTEVVLLNQDSANLWRIHNNAFDHCAVSSLFTPLTNSHNAYINCDGRLTPTNVHDVVLGSFNYASGPLGDFYHASTNLINAGSVTNAALAGLYHYTTTTNQVKEGNSRLDIGLHYVALNGLGHPVDSDGDGVPDYLEDRNGNGTYEAGDLANWQNPDTDGDGLPDGWEIQHGLDPLTANAAVIFVAEPKATSNIP